MDVQCLIVIHVDDGMGGSNCSQFLAWIKKEILREFGLKDLGDVTQFLGVQFERNLSMRELWMHQKEYIHTLLEDYELLDCNTVSTPMDSSSSLSTNGPLCDSASEFQALMGRLLFLSICTRPDISYAVNRLTQHNAHLTVDHLAVAKRVLRYLKGTQNLCIHYQATPYTMSLSAFSDSDWAGLLDRVSVILLGGI